MKSGIIIAILIIVFCIVVYISYVNEKKDNAKEALIKDDNKSDNEKIITLLSIIEDNQRNTEIKQSYILMFLIIGVIVIAFLIYPNFELINKLNDANKVITNELYNIFTS